MNRLLALAIAAPMLLIGAADPDLAMRDVAAADARATTASPLPGPVSYRPCRPGPGDDNCIQLYERGVRTAYVRWLRDRGGDQGAQAAVGGPDEPRASRPRRARHARAEHRAPASAGTRCPPQAHRSDEGETRGM